MALATVLPGVVVPVSGTLSVGSVTAIVSIGTVQVVGTLDALLGTVNAAIVGGTVNVQGTVTVGGGTVQSQPASYAFTDVSATIKGSAGVLYQINASGESGLVAGPGTLLAMDGAATLAVLPVAAGGFVSAPFGPGVGFGTLIASIIGDVDATFVFR